MKRRSSDRPVSWPTLALMLAGGLGLLALARRFGLDPLESVAFGFAAIVALHPAASDSVRRWLTVSVLLSAFVLTTTGFSRAAIGPIVGLSAWTAGVGGWSRVVGRGWASAGAVVALAGPALLWFLAHDFGTGCWNGLRTASTDAILFPTLLHPKDMRPQIYVFWGIFLAGPFTFLSQFGLKSRLRQLAHKNGRANCG